MVVPCVLRVRRVGMQASFGRRSCRLSRRSVTGIRRARRIPPHKVVEVEGIVTTGIGERVTARRRLTTHPAIGGRTAMAVDDSTHVTIVKRCRCDADAWDTCRHFWQLAVSKHDERPVFHDVQRALVPFKDLTLPTTRTDFEPFQRYAEAALARCD